MSETISFWLIGGGGSFIVAFITFWMMLSSRLTTAENKAAAAIESAKDARSSAMDEAKSANLMATTALAKHELLVRDINENRVEITSRISSLDAVTRSTSASLEQVEKRLASSIADIGSKIERLSENIYREFATRHKDKQS